jgi:hypothetical protein
MGGTALGSRAVTSASTSGVPSCRQNLAPGLLTAPHVGHRIPSDAVTSTTAPHLPQNFTPAFNGSPQDLQYMMNSIRPR